MIGTRPVVATIATTTGLWTSDLWMVSHTTQVPTLDASTSIPYLLSFKIVVVCSVAHGMSSKHTFEILSNSGRIISAISFLNQSDVNTGGIALPPLPAGWKPDRRTVVHDLGLG